MNDIFNKKKKCDCGCDLERHDYPNFCPDCGMKQDYMLDHICQDHLTVTVELGILYDDDDESDIDVHIDDAVYTVTRELADIEIFMDKKYIVQLGDITVARKSSKNIQIFPSAYNEDDFTEYLEG